MTAARIRSLPPTDQKRFVSEAALPVWRRIAGVAPILLMLVVSTTSLQLVLAAWLVVQLLADIRAHHQKLAALGFGRAFRGQLLRVSCLGGMVILMLTVGAILRGVAA